MEISCYFNSCLPIFHKNLIDMKILFCELSIDVLPSKNQVLCEYCTHLSNYQLSLNTADTLISVFLLLVSHMRRDSSLMNA